jgi:hypothetical protein
MVTTYVRIPPATFTFRLTLTRKEGFHGVIDCAITIKYPYRVIDSANVSVYYLSIRAEISRKVRRIG